MTSKAFSVKKSIPNFTDHDSDECFQWMMTDEEFCKYIVKSLIKAMAIKSTLRHPFHAPSRGAILPCEAYSVACHLAPKKMR